MKKAHLFHLVQNYMRFFVLLLMYTNILKAGIKVYTVKQQLGDLVIIPSGLGHCVIAKVSIHLSFT
jgi:cupin superfamily acireductone dioxygenase involved in methionine salvage